MVQCDLDCGSHGICVGDNTCVCFRGYKGEACKQFSCSEVNECSGHGTCSNPNKCQCDEGWLGDTCNVPSCSGMNHCSKHGRCIGVNRCVYMGHVYYCIKLTLKMELKIYYHYSVTHGQRPPAFSDPFFIDGLLCCINHPSSTTTWRT